MSYRKVWQSNNADYRAEATQRLRELFPPGSTVTTTVKHVTRSGMGRTIAVLAIDPDDKGTIRNVSRDVARVLDWREDSDRQGVYVEGCGMDMCFHLTYTLARVLHATDENWRNAGYSLESKMV